MKTESTYKNLFSQYSEYKEDSIVSKYIRHNQLKSLIEKLPQQLFQVIEVGQSVEGREIFSIKINVIENLDKLEFDNNPIIKPIYISNNTILN